MLLGVPILGLLPAEPKYSRKTNLKMYELLDLLDKSHSNSYRDTDESQNSHRVILVYSSNRSPLRWKRLLECFTLNTLIIFADT
jgi:hypothetical protein